MENSLYADSVSDVGLLITCVLATGVSFREG